MLRFRSDEQLVALFRAGHEDAFRAIHDRYHKRLFAYARQMLPARQDAEDALQDVFVRAYSGLRASQRDLALKAWLFRVAHNRCVDELRKPGPPPPEVLELLRTSVHDPVAELDRRESLRRLVQDIRRLPDQQRSALLMRELGGMSYTELASSLGVSVGAVKSLLVRARLALGQASEARETACGVIREQLVEAYDRGVRPSANARRHMRDCSACKSFRGDLRGVSRQIAAVAPTIGPLGLLANLLGFSGGSGAGGGAAVIGGGASASVGGAAISTSHLTALIVAAVATAGGAVEIQRTILPQAHHPSRAATATSKAPAESASLASPTGYSGASAAASRPSLSVADTAADASRRGVSGTSAQPSKKHSISRTSTGTSTAGVTTTGTTATACGAAASTGAAISTGSSSGGVPGTAGSGGAASSGPASTGSGSAGPASTGSAPSGPTSSNSGASGSTPTGSASGASAVPGGGCGSTTPSSGAATSTGTASTGSSTATTVDTGHASSSPGTTPTADQGTSGLSTGTGSNVTSE